MGTDNGILMVIPILRSELRIKKVVEPIGNVTMKISRTNLL